MYNQTLVWISCPILSSLVDGRRSSLFETTGSFRDALRGCETTDFFSGHVGHFETTHRFMNRLMISGITRVFINRWPFMNEPPISKSPLCIYKQGGGFEIAPGFRDAASVRKGQSGTRNQNRGQIMHPITMSRVSNYEPDQTTMGELILDLTDPIGILPQKWDISDPKWSGRLKKGYLVPLTGKREVASHTRISSRFHPTLPNVSTRPGAGQPSHNPPARLAETESSQKGMISPCQSERTG
jgi:hypothetical protein